MDTWPELSVVASRDTHATLALYTQIVGKIRLALTPKMNEWWNVPLYVTTRGLTTSPMPSRHRTLSFAFDFSGHHVLIRDGDGHTRALALVPPLSVSDFYRALFAELGAIDVKVEIHPTPQECPVTLRFHDDAE